MVVTRKPSSSSWIFFKKCHGRKPVGIYYFWNNICHSNIGMVKFDKTSFFFGTNSAIGKRTGILRIQRHSVGVQSKDSESQNCKGKPQ